MGLGRKKKERGEKSGKKVVENYKGGEKRGNRIKVIIVEKRPYIK